MKVLGAAFMVLTLFLGACADTGSKTRADGPIRVVTALYPATFLAERIGGDGVEVAELAPAGAEPHDLEMTAGQIRELDGADLIIYAGSGFQPALEDAVADLSEERRLDILHGRDVARGEGATDHPEEDEHDEEDEHAGEVDPHIWLDLDAFPDIAHELGDRLAALDPANADDYLANAQDLVAELQKLDDAFATGLRDCARREIVVAHQAFGYLADRYDLEEVAFAGLDPEAEPSPARLAEVTEFAREHGVTTIFYEELTSPAAAEALASELGLKTSVLSPIETRPEDGDYLSAMQNNLSNLRSALDCV